MSQIYVSVFPQVRHSTEQTPDVFFDVEINSYCPRATHLTPSFLQVLTYGETP